MGKSTMSAPPTSLLPPPPQRAQSNPFLFSAPRETTRAFSPQLRDLPSALFLRPLRSEQFSPVFHAGRIGGHRAAAQTAGELSRLHSGDVRYLVEFARQLLAGDQTQRALDILLHLLNNGQSRNATALSLAAYAHMLKGNGMEALRLFGQAALINPADCFSLINRHFVQRQINSPRNAPAFRHAELTVATSLPPRDVDVSRRAVDSWLELGFQVISVNTEEECRLLRKDFPEVRFCISNKTAKEITGKDHQYVDALLDALSAYGTDICAIVNADIVLRGGRESWAQLAARAEEGFVFISRVNVENLEDKAGHMYTSGFDCFLFAKHMPTAVPRTRFVIGQPFWDIFFPACAQFAGIPAYICYSPVALHKNHATNWSSDLFINFGFHFFELLAPAIGVLFNEHAEISHYLRAITNVFAETATQAIRGNSHPLFCENSGFDNVLAPIDLFYCEGLAEKTLITW